jgi:hypothetical protein
VLEEAIRAPEREERHREPAVGIGGIVGFRQVGLQVQAPRSWPTTAVVVKPSDDTRAATSEAMVCGQPCSSTTSGPSPAFR